MNKFIIKTFLFFLILFLINIIFGLIFEKEYYKGYSDVKLSYDSFLLADSHGKYLGDFKEEAGVYNYSANSDSYFDMLRKVRYLIEKTKIRRILISLDKHSLSEYREILNNLDRSVILTKPSDFNNILEYIYHKYIKRYIAFANIKSRDIIKLEIIRGLRSFLNIKDDSIAWSTLSEYDRMQWAKEWASDKFEGKKKSEKLTSALEEIIKICKSNQIELIGIKFPMPRESYFFIANKSYGEDTLFQNQGLSILDFSTTYLDNDEYFLDPSHLNSLGSKIFTDTLLTVLTKQK